MGYVHLQYISDEPRPLTRGCWTW